MARRRAAGACPRGSRRSATAVAGTLAAALLALLTLLVPAAAGAAGPGHASVARAAAVRDLAAHAAGPCAACAAPAWAWRAAAPGERHPWPLDATTAPVRTALTGPPYTTTRPDAARDVLTTALAAPCRGRAPPISAGS
ncbi:hypothetical protein PV703_04975 [Streptomyces sp. ME01-24h]|nr:hypothetical protein [Streptomyces sp. ME19-03-3]MDX3352687.1 hypothetical protein [Streptomyces sp. ME01-24h]